MEQFIFMNQKHVPVAKPSILFFKSKSQKQTYDCFPPAAPGVALMGASELLLLLLFFP